MTNFDWKVEIWLGPQAISCPGEFVAQVQAPSVEEAIVLAFEKYRETHKNLEHVLGFHIDAKNLTIEKITRSSA